MSDADMSMRNPQFGWHGKGQMLEWHGVAFQSISVSLLPDGRRFIEIRDGERAVWQARLPADAAAHLARLLMADDFFPAPPASPGRDPALSGKGA